MATSDANHRTTFAVLPEGGPNAVSEGVAVWTGSQMVVWGGAGACTLYGVCGDGAAFSPTANGVWEMLPELNAPSARALASGVWADDRLFVWGGRGCGKGTLPCADGATLDVKTRVWKPLPLVDAPSARMLASATWTGDRVLIWGGQAGVGGMLLHDGAAFSFKDGTWQAMPAQGAPSPRRYHGAVWTGDKLIVWGGDIGGAQSVGTNDGAALSSANNKWLPIANARAPAARWAHTTVWTGRVMLVWGGLGCGTGQLCGDGGRYDPAKDEWQPISKTGAPSARVGHSAVWTGQEMIVFGGGSCEQATCSDAFAYEPNKDEWRMLGNAAPQHARGGHYAVWTGLEMLVWGGRNGETERRDGARMRP